MKFIAPLACILVFTAPGPPANGAVTRGPYVQMGTTTTMTVVWRTDAPATLNGYYSCFAGLSHGTRNWNIFFRAEP